MYPFGAQLRAFADKTGRRMDEVVRSSCLYLFREITLLTPVRTGVARGNWRVGIGAPDLSTQETGDKSGGATIGKASAKIGTAKAGGIIYITSALPYIRRLEYGWSAQNRRGMVRVTVAGLKSAIYKAVNDGR